MNRRALSSMAHPAPTNRAATVTDAAVSGLGENPAASSDAASTGQRWTVIGAVVILSFLTILARAGISGAKIEMARDLNISDPAFGVVFGAFALGYAVCMIPCGLLADQWGPRKALTLSVFLWSLFTLATGLASSVFILIEIRFLFGLGEAGVFPQAACALRNWTLPRERGLALGLLNMGSRLGAAFALLATPVSVERLGWRQSFAVLGICGFVWAAVWFLYFRDKPGARERTLAVSSPSADSLGAPANPTPWRDCLASRNFYLIMYQYFASQFTFFICLSWLLPFSKSRFGISTSSAGLYSSVPLYCGAVAMWVGGVAIDKLYKAGRWKLSRRLPAMFGFGLAAAALLPAPFMRSPAWFIGCFALATFGLDLTVSASWPVCCDVGGRYSGTLSAAMNTMGALGSLASSLLFPLLVGAAQNITLYFCVAALLNVVAMVCWNYIDPAASLVSEQKFVEV